MARRIIHIQRAALLLGGPDVTWNPQIDDDNPPRWYDPLPSGPYKGQTTSKEDFLTKKKMYFKKIGWTQKGRPRSSELRRLGLTDLNRILRKRL
jgi:aldehyde:ferredoxin oxidoreductase